MVENLQDSENDDTSEARILSFVVRVWREESNNKDDKTIWRGFIFSIPHGKRHYFCGIKEIPALIAARLKVQR